MKAKIIWTKDFNPAPSPNLVRLPVRKFYDPFRILYGAHCLFCGKKAFLDLDAETVEGCEHVTGNVFRQEVGGMTGFTAYYLEFEKKEVNDGEK